MNESQNDYILRKTYWNKPKNPDTKAYMLCDSIYMKFYNMQN